jgi:hypothetical protein
MNEYAVFADRLNDTDTPEMIIVLDDDGVTGVCREQELSLYWDNYFRQSEDWSNRHLMEDHPLQSVFRSAYSEVEFKDIDGPRFGQDVDDLIDGMEEDGDIYMFNVPLG